MEMDRQMKRKRAMGRLRAERGQTTRKSKTNEPSQFSLSLVKVKCYLIEFANVETGVAELVVDGAEKKGRKIEVGGRHQCL